MNNSQNLSAIENFITFEEASKLLKVSKSFLYKLTHKKQIPHYKPTGKLVYFNKTDLEKFLLSGKVKTNEEISELADKIILKKGGK